MRRALSFALVLAIAGVLRFVPGGGETLTVALTLLTMGFFTGIALLGARLYRQNRMTLDTMDDRRRLVLYASIGGALLVFTATDVLFHGAGILVWIVLLGLCSFGVFWVLSEARRYP